MPGKTALRTDWVQICTSGKTVDGRNISPQDIQDMADTYNVDEYTAVINYEHYSWAGNFGTVLALKAEQNHKDETCLFAVIAPNKHLMQLNADGQKLFTSIELMPNFADTGKAYLGGLALTDSPASRGTTQLNFSHRVTKEHILSTPAQFNLAMPAEDEQAPSWFTQFINKFNQSASTGANTPNEDQDMTEEQLNKLMGNINTSIDQKFSELEQKIEPTGDGEEAASGGGAPEANAFSTDDAKQLQEQVTNLSAQVTELSSTIEKLSSTPDGQDTPEGGEAQKVY